MSRVVRRPGSQPANIMTPQSKIMSVNDRLGNKGIKYQQGTTRIIYDFLKYKSGVTQYEFFKNCKTRLFPYTNLEQNILQTGETIALEAYYLMMMQTDDTTNEVIQIVNLAYYPQGNPVFRSDFQFWIGNSRVLKDVSITSAAASFNLNAKFANPVVASSDLSDPTKIVNTNYVIDHEVYPLKTDLVIPPDIEFWCTLQQGGGGKFPVTEGRSWYIGMCFEGVGSILSPKTNF